MQLLAGITNALVFFKIYIGKVFNRLECLCGSSPSLGKQNPFSEKVNKL